MYFLILLFTPFLILLPSLNLQIIIYLELEKYESIPVILILFVIIILFINLRTVYSILFYYY